MDAPNRFRGERLIMPLLCAWASRHAPLPVQSESLTTAGYRIVQIGDARDLSIQYNWIDILRGCGYRIPDLLVLITRHEQVTPMVLHVAALAPQIAIVRPIMQRDDRTGHWYWSGGWKRYIVVPRPNGRRGTHQTRWTPDTESRDTK